MIRGEYWHLLEDDALAKNDAAAIPPAQRGGLSHRPRGTGGLLKAVGCQVDPATRRCVSPKAVFAGREHLAVRRAGRGSPIGWNPQYQLRHGGSYPHLLGGPAAGDGWLTRDDVQALAAEWPTCLPEFATVGRVLTCCEIERGSNPFGATLMRRIPRTNRRGRRDLPCELYRAASCAWASAFGQGQRPSLVAACDFFIAPLIMDHEQAECFITKRRHGLRHHAGNDAGVGDQRAGDPGRNGDDRRAELLAGWVMGYAANPALPVGGHRLHGHRWTSDGFTCFSSPEAKLQDGQWSTLCRRLYGIRVGPAINYVEAKRPGLEATFHKMFSADRRGGGGAVPGIPDGLLSAGQDYSPVQHLLDVEAAKAVERFWGHFRSGTTKPWPRI